MRTPFGPASSTRPLRQISARANAIVRRHDILTQVILAAKLRHAIESAASDIGPDRLAFLTLTSKPELQIRDALAWQLHQEHVGIVAREWRRTDLAILDTQGKPLVLLEAKVMATFDAVSESVRERFLGYLSSDHSKASRLANTGTRIYLLLIVTHTADPIPEPLMRVVKYSSRINSSLQRHDPDDLLRDGIAVIGQELERFGTDVVTIPLGTGEAFGITCQLTAFLIGPFR